MKRNFFCDFTNVYKKNPFITFLEHSWRGTSGKARFPCRCCTNCDIIPSNIPKDTVQALSKTVYGNHFNKIMRSVREACVNGSMMYPWITSIV